MALEAWKEWAEGGYATDTPRREQPVAMIDGDVTANPDTPVTNGGIPFWERVWAWTDHIPLSYGSNAKVIDSVSTKTKATMAGAKSLIDGSALAAGANRLIVILVLVLVGMALFNRILTRAGA